MTSRDLTYDLDPVAMSYGETTAPSDSMHRTFVLVHGIGMGRVVFDGISGKLAAEGRVLAVDLPGFGNSPEPGTAATLEQTAEVVAQFVRDRATGPAVLVGHSMGTQIVAEVAYRHPELVEALVLIAPTVNPRERSAIRQGLRMAQDLVGESPRVLLLGLREYVKTSPRWFLNKLRFMLAHRLEEICPDIEAPALVLSGETDCVSPREWARQVASALPAGTFEPIPKRGHEAIIRSPEPVASMILDFVRSRCPERE
ncbi:alpha/beta hydrolase [Leucobacter alluvii]|uniref:Alpha/beta hydrolase n=1 Tax=Leucobacter alluvii TaxID=340321 RepID=A0ABN3B274_9MICO